MFVDDLKEYVNTYCDEIPELKKLGRKPSTLLIDFCIDKFKSIRNYPNTFNAEKIEADLYANKSVIAMAIIDLFNKEGAEGESSHSEGGISRQYESSFISGAIFKDVLPFIGLL